MFIHFHCCLLGWNFVYQPFYYFLTFHRVVLVFQNVMYFYLLNRLSTMMVLCQARPIISVLISLDFFWIAHRKNALPSRMLIHTFYRIIWPFRIGMRGRWLSGQDFLSKMMSTFLFGDWFHINISYTKYQYMKVCITAV